MKAAEAVLEQGLQQYGLNVSFDAFMCYLTLLYKWNRAYNLTAVREPAEMVVRHIFDSIAILPWVKGPRVLDVGTGAGLPGIPLALARPAWQWSLLDSNGKKTRFLQEVKRVLSLENVDILQTRVEDYAIVQQYDTVVSRAFSDLDPMISKTVHLLRPDGIWLAMKGKYPAAALRAIPYSYRVEAYSVVGLQEERCCVIIENSKELPWQKS